MLVASLSRAGDEDAASVLGDLLEVPVHSPVSEPAAARLGALTTPGARDDAIVVDLGAGTIDVIGPGGSVVAAGAGELLTAAVAEMLGIPRASADWVKRGPCVRVDGGQRFEGEDGSRGFLDVPAPASAAGMLAVEGPGGWLPFDRRHGPGEWRAIRLRLKQAVLAANFGRAVRTLGEEPARSSWSAARPVTRNCSACSPGRCRTAWPSAAATSAAPARAGRSATATRSRSAWPWPRSRPRP